MANTNPKFSCGVWVPNPTFSIPNRDGSPGAEGWSEYFAVGSPTYEHVYDQDEAHGAVLKVSGFSGGSQYLTLESPWLEPGALTLEENATWTMRGILRAKITGTASAAIKVTSWIDQYNAAGLIGSVLSSSTPEITQIDSAGAWVTDDAEHTCLVTASDVTRYKAKVKFETTASNSVFYVSFVGFGVWDGSTASSFTTRLPSFPGTFSNPAEPPASGSSRGYDTLGFERIVRLGRQFYPYAGALAFNGLTDTERKNLNRMWTHQEGLNVWSTSETPTGTPRPILVAPGNIACPGAMYVLQTSPPSYTPIQWSSTTNPIYGGTFPFVERLL